MKMCGEMYCKKIWLFVTITALLTSDLTRVKAIAESVGDFEIHDLTRVARQADLKLKNHENVSNDSSIEGRLMTENNIEHDVKAKGKASGSFDLGLGLSGFSLTGTGDATEEVDSKGNVGGKGQANGNAKSRSSGILGSILNGGLFFPDFFGNYAPEDDSWREKREVNPRFKRQLDIKRKEKSELGGDAEGNAKHGLKSKDGANGGFGFGLGLSELTLTGTADATGEVDSKETAEGKSQAEAGAEEKSKGLLETMLGSGFIFGKRKKRDTNLHAVQFSDTHLNGTISKDNFLRKIQKEIPIDYNQIYEILTLITGKNKYSDIKKYYKPDKTIPDNTILVTSMDDKNGNRIKRQVETDKVVKLASRLGQYNLQAWQIDEMLRGAPPQRRKQILQNYAPEVLDINPRYLDRYETI